MRHPKSEIETYHIINRGVNDMNIFRNNEDKDEYLHLLGKGARKYGVTIYAYCLMDNHYHLLLHASDNEYKSISGMMRYINSKYVRYFNATDKTDKDGDPRSGTIFKGSYVAVPVNNNLQIEKVLMYIHNNPTPITNNIESYKYSSYHRYINVLSGKNTVEEENSHGVVLELASMTHLSLKEFKTRTKESSKYKFCEGKKSYIGKNYMTDCLLVEEIKERFEICALDIMNMNEKDKSKYLYKIDKIPGISKKQLERVLRIDYAELCRLIRKYKISICKTNCANKKEHFNRKVKVSDVNISTKIETEIYCNKDNNDKNKYS